MHPGSIPFKIGHIAHKSNLPLPGLALLSDSIGSDLVCCAIGQRGAMVGGMEHTLVTELLINLSFWEAAAEYTSFNLCTTFLHFTEKN